MLGIEPLLGHFLTDDEDQPGGPRVAAISHGRWQRRFGGDPTVIGRDIRLDDATHTLDREAFFFLHLVLTAFFEDDWQTMANMLPDSLLLQ